MKWFFSLPSIPIGKWFNKFHFPMGCFLLFMGGSFPAFSQGLISYVQTYAGTAASTTPAALKHSEGSTEKNANTIPAVTRPFAMTQWSPQTRTTEVKCQPPYFYRDTLFSGIRATHWLSGSCTQDYGSFTFMPLAGQLKLNYKEYTAAFHHEDETSTPAYYKINLRKYHVAAEVTSTLRAGLIKLTAQQNDSMFLLIMPNSDQGKGFVKFNKATGEVWGYNPVHRIYQGWGQEAGFSGWFYMKVDPSVVKYGTFSNNTLYNTDSVKGGDRAGVYLGWVAKKGQSFTFKIGTSFTGREAAKNNLKEEIGSQSFIQIQQESLNIWNTALSSVKVEGAETDKEVLYTSMYHAMQHPRLMSDCKGDYPAFSSGKKMNIAGKGQYYDDFSMWDIYRAQLPLWEMLRPDLVNQWVRSCILKGQQGGWLPIFPCWNSYTAAMIGDHVSAFIASAFVKGIKDYDVQRAYALMRKNAFEFPNDLEVYKTGMGRRALPSYLKYGFIPLEDTVPFAFHKKEQVSRTLEYALDDFAVSIIAKALHKNSDYNLLRQRAFNYRNVFDTSVKLVRGKYADTSWIAGFYPDRRESYITEGTPRQYTFYVPHNIPDLAQLMGGVQSLESSLDTLFAQQQYWHGNEPGHQIPFLYNYTAAPWKTQAVVHKILKEEYDQGPGGLSGNDDAGQMSAWYIFGALGFYPVNPVSDKYMLSSPLFRNIRLKTSEGKYFKVVSHATSSKAIYIQHVKWQGKPYLLNYITHDMILNGGTLEMWLQESPGNWGSQLSERDPGMQ